MSDSSAQESQTSSQPKLRNWGLADSVLGVFFLAVCVNRFRDYAAFTLAQSSDICWLIRTGDWMIANGHLLDQNLFCWWKPELRPISYQWLFEVMSSVLHHSIGIWGIGLLSNICAGVFLFCLLPGQWLRTGLPFSITFFFLTLVPSRYWNFPRPQTASCVLLYILLAVLENFRANTASKKIYLIPLLMLAWVNLHLTWTLGWLISTIYFAASFRRNKTDQAVKRKLAITYAAILVCLLLNPSGIQTLSTHFFSFANGNQYLKIYECLPAYSTHDMQAFLAYCSLALISLVYAKKLIPLEGLFMSVFAIALGVFTNRFEPISVIVSWPYVGLALSAILKKIVVLKDISQGVIGARWQRITGGLLVALLVPTAVWMRQCPDKNSALQQLIPASPALLALPAERHRVRLFNDPLVGNWMILLDTGKPMICSRFDMYNAEDIAELSECLSAKPDFWKPYLQRLNPDAILIPFADPLSRHLAEPGSNWQLIAKDKVLTYWEKSDASATTVESSTPAPHTPNHP